MLRPPCGATSSAFGGPDTLVAGRAIREIELRQPRMERNHHRLGLQRDRVADDVVAGREIQDRMRVDGLADGLGVVGLPVTLHAQRADVDPGVGRRAARGSPEAAAAGSAASGAAS